MELFAPTSFENVVFASVPVRVRKTNETQRNRTNAHLDVGVELGFIFAIVRSMASAQESAMETGSQAGTAQTASQQAQATSHESSDPEHSQQSNVERQRTRALNMEWTEEAHNHHFISNHWHRLSRCCRVVDFVVHALVRVSTSIHCTDLIMLKNERTATRSVLITRRKKETRCQRSIKVLSSSRHAMSTQVGLAGPRRSAHQVHWHSKLWQLKQVAIRNLSQCCIFIARV